MYRPLALPEDLPDTVRLGIDAGAEPLLRDVHTMLRLPMPAADLRTGCGFSIVNNLMSIVSAPRSCSTLRKAIQAQSSRLFSSISIPGLQNHGAKACALVRERRKSFTTNTETRSRMHSAYP
jgi:hypothetical protein